MFSYYPSVKKIYKLLDFHCQWDYIGFMRSFIVHPKGLETELLKPNKMSMKKALKKVKLKYLNQIVLLEYWNKKGHNTMIVDTKMKEKA